MNVIVHQYVFSLLLLIGASLTKHNVMRLPLRSAGKNQCNSTSAAVNGQAAGLGSSAHTHLTSPWGQVVMVESPAGAGRGGIKKAVRHGAAAGFDSQF